MFGHNVSGCKCPLVSWRAEAAWALTLHDCDNLAWALTREWALSIHTAKTSTWAPTREWALCPGHYGTCTCTLRALHGA